MMLSFTGWLILGLSLGGGVLVAACVLMWHLAYTDGYNDGRDYEKQRAIRARESAERSRGRRSPSPAAAPWYQQVPARPQPSRISGAGTVTMPAALTDTGELRALTDDFIEGMTAKAEADRREVLS